MKVPAKNRVLNALIKGKNLTPDQISTKFGVTNPSAMVSRLRGEGYAIYLNTRTKRSGEKVSHYRLGTPSASMLEKWATRGVTPQTV